MNVVFISSQHFPFGMAGSKRIKLFAEFLAKNNTVKVLVIGDSNGVNDLSGNNNNVIYEFHKFSRIQTFTAYKKIKHLLLTNQKNNEKNCLFLYDGVGLTNFLYAYLGKKFRYKVLTDVVEDYSVHNEKAGFFLTILHKINFLFEKKTFQIVDGVIVISNRLFSKFDKLNKTKKPLILIPISAENLSVEFPKKDDNTFFTFIYSGSYGIKDGVSFLIDAFNEICKSYLDVRLVLAGKINDFVENKISANPAVSYKGLIPDSDYYRFLSDADVLLMTRINSEYANTGFPFKLGEYLASSNPVIVTKVSDVDFYLKDKVSAIFAEPSDVKSLVSAMEYAIRNKQEIKSIGKEGRKNCELFFNPIINSQKLEGLLKSL